MLVQIVLMTKLTDPLKPLKRWADRQRKNQALLSNNRKPRMNPESARRDHHDMLRFMALNALGGVVIGLVLAGVLVLLDVGGLFGLLRRAANPVVPLLLVMVPFASLFWAAAAATAILTMPYETKFRDDGDKPPTDD